MAPLRSDLRLESSQYLDEAVDPTQGVWGTLKESARITLKLRTVVGMLVLVLLSRMALGILSTIYGGGWTVLEGAAVIPLVAVAHAGVVRAVLEAYDAEHASSTREGYQFVECLKPRLNRKLLKATLRIFGTSLAIIILCLGSVFLVVFVIILCTQLLEIAQKPLQLVALSLVLLLTLAAMPVLGWYVATSFLLARTVCILEPGTWGVGALSRSSKLVNGHRWKAVALALLCILLYTLVFVSTDLLSLLVKPFTWSDIGIAAALLASSLWTTVMIAVDGFSAVVSTVFYLKCRAYWSAAKYNVGLDSRGYQLLWNTKIVSKGE